MDEEQFSDLVFPVNGTNVASEFSAPPPETTPSASNVRAYEPATLRERGGSRNGLVKFIPATVNGTALIQDLNLVVYTDESGLLTGNDPLDPNGGVPDPSSNNLTIRNPGAPSNPRRVRNGGSGTRPNRNVATHGKLTPIVTARNQVKAAGTQFNFAGTEFTQTGLLAGDAYTAATITSAGQIASAPPGQYQIAIANPVPNTSLSLHQGQGLYNPTRLVFGILTVSPLAPIAINLRLSGGRSPLNLRSLAFTSSAVSGPFLGYKKWRIVQYLQASGFPTFVLSESDVVDASGVPQNVVNPAPNMYAPTGPPPMAVDYNYTIRFEVSVDGTTWPNPPF